MKPLRRLSEIAPFLKEKGVCKRVAVAWAEDLNTLEAVGRATKEGLIHPLLFGREIPIREAAKKAGDALDSAELRPCADEGEALAQAVEAVKNGEADILMKGLVGTDKFLKAVLHKEHGLMRRDAVMSYTCAIELPAYHKLLFVSDTAVLPFPDLDQKIAMIDYSVEMAHKFGIETPRVALIGASEKVSPHFPNSIDYALISRMNARKQITGCVVDGPLDIFCACDPESLAIKGVASPLEGDADILIFPSLEASNAFYKGLMLFAGGELAGLIQGTEKPVVVMSRSETALSKFYCMALACLVAES